MVTAKEMCAQGLLLGFFPAYYKSHKCLLHGTSLVVQSIRIHLPMQGTRVRSLGGEDPTCCRATKPVPQPPSPCSRARRPQPPSPSSRARRPQPPSPCSRARRPQHRVHARGPGGHNHQAQARGPRGHNHRVSLLQLLKPTRLQPVLCNKRSHDNEKPVHHNYSVAPARCN